MLTLKVAVFVLNWVASCKPAWCDYVVVIFQFGMSTLFVLKNVPCFFKNAENMDRFAWNSTPLPLPLSVSKQRRISIATK